MKGGDTIDDSVEAEAREGGCVAGHFGGGPSGKTAKKSSKKHPRSRKSSTKTATTATGRAPHHSNCY
jgi:hypothetical protein